MDIGNGISAVELAQVPTNIFPASQNIGETIKSATNDVFRVEM